MENSHNIYHYDISTNAREMRCMVPILILGCIAASVMLISCNQSEHNPTNPIVGGKSTGSIQTIHWGTLHNNALANIHNNSVPASYPSHIPANGSSAAGMLQAMTIPYFVSQGIDTSGFSTNMPTALGYLATWWSDSVTRRPNSTDYAFSMAYWHNASAVNRVLNYLNGSDGDLASMSQSTLVSNMNSICDSLLSALALQSNVDEEIAFVQIAKSSTNYWNSFNDPDWGGTISSSKELAAVIQADAGGYIYGWVAAIIIENATTGEVRIENQYKRIAAGAAMAVNASGGGTVKIAGAIGRWISGLW